MTCEASYFGFHRFADISVLRVFKKAGVCCNTIQFTKLHPWETILLIIALLQNLDELFVNHLSCTRLKNIYKLHEKHLLIISLKVSIIFFSSNLKVVWILSLTGSYKERNVRSKTDLEDGERLLRMIDMYFKNLCCCCWQSSRYPLYRPTTSYVTYTICPSVLLWS